MFQQLTLEHPVFVLLQLVKIILENCDRIVIFQIAIIMMNCLAILPSFQ